MNMERRVALLEARSGGRRDSSGCVLLSPYDAAILIIERANLGDSPEHTGRVARIDALLEGHSRAAAYRRPKPLTPEEADKAMQEASERDDDSEAAEKYRTERLDELLAMR